MAQKPDQGERNNPRGGTAGIEPYRRDTKQPLGRRVLVIVKELKGRVLRESETVSYPAFSC